MHFFLYFCSCLPAVSDLPVIFAMFRQTCFPSRELIQQLFYLQIADFARDFHLNPAIVATTLTCHVKESCYCSLNVLSKYSIESYHPLKHRLFSKSLLAVRRWNANVRGIVRTTWNRWLFSIQIVSLVGC